ncbi:hypothetical protein [Tautonia sociabilis]|uniref:Uncharacterized protein n=1 Tax=Tautonia sociabilis TaxID=2080755 RepID=A0A432MMT9_9BACT|nr:hypothetical protein [Tautonia sociabilis]RUL88764.1 hypothetical protein TsocGM_05245 [Tautonia sociabilis]
MAIRRGLRVLVPGLFLLAFGPRQAASGGAAGPETLAERAEPGSRSLVVVTLEADGRYRPGPGDEDRPIELSVRSSLEYVEQVLAVDPSGAARRSSRRVDSASVTIEGDGGAILPSSIALRPEVVSLVADRGAEGEVVVASPSGPLTRPELELVQLPADPLVLPAFLPPGPVAEGDRWPLPDSVARSISGYDTLSSRTIEATLRSLEDARAQVEFSGRIEGAVLGALGQMDIEGSYQFDRETGRIATLFLRRSERREPGQVEAGLEFQSELTLQRSDAEEDDGHGLVQRVVEELPSRWLLLRYEAPDGRYHLEHDRSWYVFSEDDRQSVLRCVEGGSVLCQANLVVGPTIEPGARPKADRFRDDVRKALGDRFERFIDAGQVAAPPGESRYRLAIAGSQGDEPITWYYYQVADASGRQLVAIFTLRASEVERFGRRDQRMIGSLRWADPDGDGPGPEEPEATPRR